MQRPPPSEAPPAYSLPQRITRYGRSNLRPAVLFVTFFSAIWGVVAGSALIRSRNDGDLPAKVDTVYLALAILYFVAAGLEAFGFYAAFKSSIRFVRAYFWCSATVALIVVAAEMTRTVIHFVDKDEIKMACADSYADDISSGLVTAGTVSDYCASNWTSGTYVDIALLLLSFFFGFFFASLAASFLHQLQNPQLLRTQQPILNSAAASNQYAYPLAPYPPQPYGAPAPPQYGNPHDLPVYDNPHGYSANSDDKPSASSPYTPSGGPAAQNPFEDSVQHSGGGEEQLTRNEGESSEEFEMRQHLANLARERREYGESTETVTMGGRAAEGRV